MRDEEKVRLEREAAEEKDFVPKLERVLVGLDGGDFVAVPKSNRSCGNRGTRYCNPSQLRGW
jgi:hypothetical protein